MVKCKNCTRLYRSYDEENEVMKGKWCDKIFDCPDVEEERECIHYKCMSNADRIRKMTDEELANILIHFDFCYLCKPDSDFYDCVCSNEEIKANVVEWLGKVAEE